MKSKQLLLAAALASLALLLSCAVNPATGKRQLSLVSTSQEKAIGRENDKAIVAEMGLVENEALQKYVNDLGQRLAARSERPDLPWTFRVVDDPIVNAFALPGGYIYITRGILAHMNNEAELAAVVGHEIGHVTARHGASQMSKAQVFQGLLGVGSIVAPEQAQRFGGIVQQGMGVAFLKFGRDDERQADDLGLRYMVAGGYDARPMVGMFEMLDRVGKASGGSPTPGWMSTHPAPTNRKQRAEARIAALDYDLDNSRVGEDDFLNAIDGLDFGPNPRDGFFKEQKFFHPNMKFRMDFPAGWKTQNTRNAVVALNTDQDAVMQLTLAPGSDPDAALAKFFSQEGLQRTGPSMGSISGLPTAGDGFAVESSSGKLRGRIGFVKLDGRVYQLLGYSAEFRWSTYEPLVRKALASFERLTDPRALAVQPQKIKVVRSMGAATMGDLIRAAGASAPGETISLINRIDPGDRLDSNGRYKMVVGGNLP